MNITWFGTATILLDDGETRLLFDPFVRQNKKINTTPLAGFTGADAILITHGHYDHLYSIPDLLQADKHPTVYCTNAPAQTLRKCKVNEDRIHVIAHGDELHFGNFTVTPIRAKHIVFDPFYILSVVPKCAFHLPTMFRIAALNRKFPSGHEIVMYDIHNGDKHILLCGSFGSFDDVEYPKNPDLFILANGGSVFVPEVTKKFIADIKPKTVLVDHFDDAFPPLTRKVDVTRLKHTIEKNHPNTKFIIPTECVPVTI